MKRYVIVGFSTMLTLSGNEKLYDRVRSRSSWNYLDRTPSSVIMDIISTHTKKEAEVITGPIGNSEAMEIDEFKRLLIRNALR